VTVPARRDRRRLGDRLVLTGAILFTIGVLATLVTVVPLFLESSRLPTPFYLLALLAPLGVGIALWGVVLLARTPRR
jgi:hypothetical protein